MLSRRNYILSERIKEYIQDNYAKGVTLTSISDYLNLSPSNVSKIFKSETGRTLSEYIKDIKLEAAEKLLLTTELSIQEITKKLDYNTTHYFIRLFKEKYGETPKVYRELNRRSK